MAGVGDRGLLLVLEHLGQMRDGAPAAAALLRAGPQLRLLATGRVSLNGAGERELAVPPLDLPDPGELPSLERLAAHLETRS